MPITNGKTTRDFRAVSNKGFHLTFPNGWTISVQFGAGNYCENYDMVFDSELSIDKKWNGEMESKDAEVWCWNKEGKHYPDDPLANQSVSDVLKLMNQLSKRKS